jgi:septum formation protein
MTPEVLVLGSRSPQRLELLQLIAPAERIAVVPPRCTAESGFEGLTTPSDIEGRLSEIARMKSEDVFGQIRRGEADFTPDRVAAIITADTIIIATDAAGRCVVLGQPPEYETWTDTVRRWFHDYLLGRTHSAVTAVCVRTVRGETRQRVVTTEVTFYAEPPDRVEWYLATGEPRGKAGGYAIQGAGGLFVSQIAGSLSNVIGLPLRELLELLPEEPGPAENPVTHG